MAPRKTSPLSVKCLYFAPWWGNQCLSGIDPRAAELLRGAGSAVPTSTLG